MQQTGWMEDRSRPKSGRHHDLGFNSLCEVLYINISQLGKYLIFPFMTGIIMAEVCSKSHTLVCQDPFPYSFIIAQKGIDRCGFFILVQELRRPGSGLHLGPSHGSHPTHPLRAYPLQSRQLGSIKKNLSESQLFRRIIQSSTIWPLNVVPVTSPILGQPPCPGNPWLPPKAHSHIGFIY